MTTIMTKQLVVDKNYLLHFVTGYQRRQMHPLHKNVRECIAAFISLYTVQLGQTGHGHATNVPL